jgi:hypothetical protein
MMRAYGFGQTDGGFAKESEFVSDLPTVQVGYVHVRQG